MWLNPLHPAVVHFPIVLAVLLPLVVTGALWARARGTAPRRLWIVAVLTAGALAMSAWVAIQTGKSQEDRVESVVPRDALHGHEEAAELLLALSGVVLLVAAAGLAGGVVGRAGRYVTLIGSLAVLAAGARAGHTGGQLVYAHGAAAAYAAPTGPGSAVGVRDHARGDHDDGQESDGS